MAKEKAQAVPKPASEVITIAAPNIQTIEFKLAGTAPLVTSRFAAKAALMAMMEEGSTPKGKKKPPKDFNKGFEDAKHKSAEGWCGIHAGAFRAGMISACRLVNFKMTLAKLSVFVLADGFSEDGTPLIRIEGGEPELVTHYVRNKTGVPDVRARPMWKKWGATLRIRYDADQFKAKDIANLLMRVGTQVGIGEGRPDSKESAGMGWGTFTIDEGEQMAEAAE